MSREFRDSGVAWLGSVPADWETVPARALFGERKAKSASSDVHLTPSQKYGVLPQEEYMQITGNKVVLNLTGADNMRHVEAGDYVSHLRSFQGGLEYAGIAGKVSAAYTVLKPKVALDSRFFKYLFKSDLYVQALQTTTDQLRDGQSIRYPEFSQIPLPQPSLDEQRVIADYLDRETAQIDAFIAKNEELITLLTERRAAAIDGAMAVSDSSRLRLKYRLKVNTGGVWGDDPTGTDDTVVLRSTEQTVDGHWQIESPALRALSRADARRFRLREGDLVVTKSSGSAAHIGKATLVDQRVASLAPAYSNFMQRLVPSELMEAKFLWYALRSRAVRDQLNLMATSTTGLGNLTGGILGNLWIPAPSLNEQHEAVEMLDRVSQVVGTAISRAARTVQLARERRAALISAAVTGKIDVRAAS